MAAGETDDQALQKAQALQRYLESVCGRYIYGHDDDTLEGIVGQLLVDNDRTLTVAESCTGGHLGMTITSVPGSSRYFLGGVLAYSNDVKVRQLGVDEKIMAEHGAVSSECAIAMATGVRRLLNSDYALAVTGIAGPDGGTDTKPVGTIFVGLASPHGAYAKEWHLGTNREYNRSRSVYAALELLRREILDIK